MEFDLGIGYGQLDGVATMSPYELRGYVRELPSVTLYATYRFNQYVGLYSGARTGIISLQDAQLFVPRDTSTSLFTISATTFEIGVPVGLDIQLTEGVHFTAEFAYARRNFNSLSFNPATSIPKDYPHSMDMSGRSIAIGFQFPIPKKQ